MQPIQGLFWLSGSFKNAFLRILNDPAWPGTLATCCKTLSTVTICNTKSMQQAKHLKTAKNLIFGPLNHSKMHFCDVWMIFRDLVTLPNVKKTFCTITICNTKSIQQTKLKKMAKNLYFGSLDHSKMHFCDFLMILHERYCSPIVKNI